MVTVTVVPMMMVREIYIMVTTDHDADYDGCQKNYLGCESDPEYNTDPDQGADPLQGYDQGADSDPGHLHKDLSLAKSFEPWGRASPFPPTGGWQHPVNVEGEGK